MRNREAFLLLALLYAAGSTGARWSRQAPDPVAAVTSAFQRAFERPPAHRAVPDFPVVVYPESEDVEWIAVPIALNEMC